MMQKVVEGILANCEELGRGKKNLLILHGWGGSLNEWRAVAEKLAERNRVTLVDLPGFGVSQKPSGDWGIYEYADWVEEFMKKTGIKEPTVLGHSFGGRVAIILGARRKAAKLVLVDAAGIEVKDFRARAFATLAPMFRRLPQKIKNWFGSPDYRTAGNMREIFVKVIGQDLRRHLGEIGCPTLVVWGERDMLLPIWQARVIKEGIKGAVLRIVWGATHWPHLEKPGELGQILEEEGI